jgi:hypothetical protein
MSLTLQINFYGFCAGLIEDTEMDELHNLVEHRLKHLHFNPPRFHSLEPADLLSKHPLFSDIQPADFKREVCNGCIMCNGCNGCIMCNGCNGCIMCNGCNGCIMCNGCNGPVSRDFQPPTICPP